MPKRVKRTPAAKPKEAAPDFLKGWQQIASFLAMHRLEGSCGSGALPRLDGSKTRPHTFILTADARVPAPKLSSQQATCLFMACGGGAPPRLDGSKTRPYTNFPDWP